MLFWLCVLIMIVGIVLCNIFKDKCYTVSWVIGSVGTICMGITVLVMTAVIICQITPSVAIKAGLEQQYKTLMYKSETNACRDELGLLNKDYIDEVQAWNVNLAQNQKYERNFWLGIFYPNIYDDFELIDLDKIVYKQEQ